MAWTRKSFYLGAHFWLAPLGAAITSPSAQVISQDGIWPDAGEPLWPTWYLGANESFEIDPKLGPKEIILVPSPGQAKARQVLVPFAVPEVKMTFLDNVALLPQLALNTQQLFATATTQFNPNGSNGPGINGILKCQKYDQNNNLIINWQSWAFIEMQGAWKGGPKILSKPEFLATLLDSANNTGAV